MSDHEQEPVTRDELAKALFLGRNGGGAWYSELEDHFDFTNAHAEADAILRDFTVTRKGEQRNETPEEALLRAIFEQPPEDEQVKLDPTPWALPGSRRRTSIQAWHPNDGVSDFVPRPGYSQNLADYSPKGTK